MIHIFVLIIIIIIIMNINAIININAVILINIIMIRLNIKLRRVDLGGVLLKRNRDLLKRKR
jgi:hypothetical protein